MSIVEILSTENPVFNAYGFWASVLVIKVLALAIWTSKTRGDKKVSRAIHHEFRHNHK
jgi:hypothetical protein